MKIRVAEILNMKEALQRLVQKEIPISTSFKLVKFTKQVNDKLIDIENSRIQLVTKFGTKNEETGEIHVDKDKTNDFMKEINNLFQEEVDIEFDQIRIEDFGNISISTSDIILLKSIIKN